MKIIFIVSSMGIGGEQKVVTLLSNKLVELGHEVTIQPLVYSKVEFDLNDEVYIADPIDNAKENLTKNLKRIYSLRKIFKEKKPDYVIAFAIIPGIISSFARIKTKAKVIVCERNDPSIYRITYKIARRISYPFASGAVFQTKDARDYFEKWLKCSSEVIENPLDINKLEKGNPIHKRKEIVAGGRLVPQKNFELLIKAFSKIESKFPEYKLKIYGNGPMRNRLISMISEKDLQRKIQILPAVIDFPKEIKNSEIFVLPSNHEGFPNILAEAMAIGLPVISTNCPVGGPKSIINNAENGILIDVGDLEGLTRSLKLYIEDQELREKCANNAYDIRNRLNIDAITDRWLNFIFKL